MCYRYWVEKSPEFGSIVDEMNHSPLLHKWQEMNRIKSSGEIRRTDIVPVIGPNRLGKRTIFPMKWGFSGKSLLINARSETAGNKPTFKDSWENRRCIVPASWYFEWEHLLGADGKVRTGNKYRIQPKNSAMTWLCGLYRIENGLPVFVILTREPGENIRFIHNRMPLILPESCINDWIRPDTKPEELLSRAMTDMAFEKLA
ncbi:MAG: SOS response-associated peptidase family protein [Firmicutes bacterium]|nr:SOS response-associated peptidase family protein [Bacillota bacterium]